jgi:hypothetical protein
METRVERIKPYLKATNLAASMRYYEEVLGFDIYIKTPTLGILTRDGHQIHIINHFNIFLSLLILAACSTIQQPPRTPGPTEKDTWDYLALGDTRTAVSDWPYLYAAHIEADLGVEVIVHNWGSSYQTSEALLELLHENVSLQETVREAEIVTVWTGGYTVGDSLVKPHLLCTDALLDYFESNLDGIIGTIREIQNPYTSMIRLLEFHQYRVNILKEMGAFEEKKACLEAYNDRIHWVGEKYGIPVAAVHTAINGPDGEVDAYEAGFLKNHYAFSQIGDALIAELLRQLGYEPLPKPYRELKNITTGAVDQSGHLPLFDLH